MNINWYIIQKVKVPVIPSLSTLAGKFNFIQCLCLLTMNLIYSLSYDEVITNVF